MIPRANPPAIEGRSRIHQKSGVTNNMNRSWEGDEPTWRASRAIWKIIEEVDADVVIDLHSSRGIYSEGSGVGQAIFPTTNARSDANQLIDRVNAELIDDDLREWHGNRVRYTRGNNQDGSNPLLTHAIGRERPATKGYLLEPWRALEMDLQVELNLRPAIWALEREGMVFA